MLKVLRFSLIVIAFVLPLLPYAKPSLAATGRFVDNGDGTVTDTERQVMWQKGDNGEEVTFEQAREYCTNLRLGKP